jgi:copper(I)-binding protein
MPAPKFRTIFLASLLAVVSLGARAEGPAQVSVSGAYARAVPPGQPNSAVFMTLTNDSDSPRALVSATSPSARTVELHTHANEGGMMRMRRIERIEIPAHGKAELKPGGLHVMLIGLKGDLNPGSGVGLSLTFDDGTKQEIEAPVRKIEAMPMPMGH